MTVSYEKYILDNEMIGIVKRILEGIKVNEETLAVKIIDRVGPGGHYLTQKHTLDWIEKEHFFPSVFDRMKYEDWMREGAKDARTLAKERVNKILDEHIPEPMDEDIEKELRLTLDEIEKREMK
jgi:trimethylamine--corrinoid protein Co-methyltransferase